MYLELSAREIAILANIGAPSMICSTSKVIPGVPGSVSITVAVPLIPVLAVDVAFMVSVVKPSSVDIARRPFG